jgi:hypothetical protein
MDVLAFRWRKDSTCTVPGDLKTFGPGASDEWNVKSSLEDQLTPVEAGHREGRNKLDNRF